MSDDSDNTVAVAFRFTPQMLSALDAYAAKLREQTFGLRANRADAARILLAKALAAEGIEVKRESAGRMGRKRKR